MKHADRPDSAREATDSSARGRRRAVLLLAAFAAGFVITGIEIALGRLLAPYFGASLNVWASIIASIIAALAIGYPLGGVLADRRPGAALPLGALLLGGLLGAALGFAIPIWLRGAMAGIGLSGAAYWLRLSGVLLLFSVPCVMLACVPPSVLRLTLRDRTTAGRDAGLLYALGSIGSVLGVLLPALWWIPELGVRATFGMFGAFAVAPALLALCCGALERPRRAHVLTLLAIIALFAASLSLHPDAPQHETVLYERDSGLQHIRVTAADTPRFKRRWLQLNEGWSRHSALLEPALATDDVWDWMALSALFARPDDGRTDVLIVGLAGGTVSNLLTRLLAPLLPGLEITGIEIDPQVIEVADRFLELDRSRLRTIAADGRVWLRGSDQQYDLILLDAYRQPSIPAHLATREYFEEVRGHLSAGGLAVLNVFARAGDSDVIDGLAATWLAVFPDAQLVEGPAANGFASRLILGGPALPLAFDPALFARIPAPLRPGWRLLRENTRDIDAADPSVSAWTDDLVPVEQLAERDYRVTRPANPTPNNG